MVHHDSGTTVTSDASSGRERLAVENRGSSIPGRVASIDLLRGLTMVAMIFVSDLETVRGLPWWTYHAPVEMNAMTYVDMVFPFFLFAVGMSVPLAIDQRSKANSSTLSIWGHVLFRSASLVAIGLILANADNGDAARMGFGHGLWGLLALGGAILFWSAPGGPVPSGWQRPLRAAGGVLMVVMAVLFRRTTPEGEGAWLDGSDLEILGLIGCTYGAVCVLYVLTRRWRWAPFAGWMGLTALCALLARRIPDLARHGSLGPIRNGALPSIAFAGVVASMVFWGPHAPRTPRAQLTLAVLLGLGAVAAGCLLAPLGISKERATPSWCLFSAGAAILIFAALHWLRDVRGARAWTAFAEPAGSNPLLTYLLPELYYLAAAALGGAYLQTRFAQGWPGVLRATGFTAGIVAISALLTRARIRMRV
jgi:heparan-alpha-glucosaminide N-acetyltransferase